MKDNETLLKRKFINQLADETGLPQVQVDFVWQTALSIVRENVLKGYSINLRGLGKFFTSDSPAGGRVSKLTGQVMPEHKLLRFKVNKGLRREVNLKTRK